ncbi:MAG: hypothetical protein ACJA1Z_001430 [Patiriisocius sp.]|jgi:hypothetical protein
MAVLFLIFSEVYRALGYYNIAYSNFVVYLAQARLILSIGVFVHYSVLNEADKKERTFIFLQ